MVAVSIGQNCSDLSMFSFGDGGAHTQLFLPLCVCVSLCLSLSLSLSLCLSHTHTQHARQGHLAVINWQTDSVREITQNVRILLPPMTSTRIQNLNINCLLLSSCLVTHRFACVFQIDRSRTLAKDFNRIGESERVLQGGGGRGGLSQLC